MKNLVVCFAIGLTLEGSSCARMDADLIIYNANILSVDADFTISESLAVKDGKIL